MRSTDLDAVRDTLLADAKADADELASHADEAARATLAVARRDAQAIVDAARADGEDDARRVAAAEVARARRAARETVLAAQAAAFDDLRDEVRSAATALRDDPGHDELVKRLSALARRQLGDATSIQVDDEDGGVVATAGSRSADYRLAAIAERCLPARGDEIEELWR